MDRRILTLPNQLTFLRLGFLPFFLIAIHYDRYGWALGILVAAGVSDGLDGVLARKLNQRTPLGAYLDPVADKLLLSSSYVVLALKGKVMWWLTLLILSRDVLILVACAAILLTAGYRPFPPSFFGKMATALEILLILVVILSSLTRSALLLRFEQILVYLVAALVIFSGLHYSFVMASRLHSE